MNVTACLMSCIQLVCDTDTPPLKRTSGEMFGRRKSFIFIGLKLSIFPLTADIPPPLTVPLSRFGNVYRLPRLPWVRWSVRGVEQLSCSPGCTAGPRMKGDNKEVVRLKAFPATVSGGKVYNTRIYIMYQVFNSMRGGRIECLISL